MAHTFGDERIAGWLRNNTYHPRSNKHGSAASLYFLEDILYLSDPISEIAKAGGVVFQEDYTVGEGGLRWNVDLVLGPPSSTVQQPLTGDREIAEGEPAEIWLAIDAKSIMTEHGKARRNRQRDINSFGDIMYYHHQQAVTGGLVLINMAHRFKSPLRDEDDITVHENIEELVDDTIDLFRELDRSQGEVNSNVDAVGCVVVEHTNLNDNHASRLVTEPPAPQEGDIVYYRKFVEIILEIVESRFL